jgi:hypothetical protein
MKTAFTFFLMAIISFAGAQKIEHYYDYNWKPCLLADARYYSLMERRDSVWHRQDYFTTPTSLQMDGSYDDTAAKIPHGKFSYFYPDGKLESIGNYVHGKKQGTWMSFHNNGIPSDSVYYENGMVKGTRKGWYSNSYMSDSIVMQLDGNGVEVTWFDNGNVSEAGRIKNNKMNGKWQYFHKSGQLASLETYNEGQLIAKEYYDESGNPMSDTTNRDREASFPGGKEGWKKYLEKHATFPGQWTLTNVDHVTIIVRATVDEDGKVSDVQVTLPFHPDFDKAAVDIIKRSSKWTPAISHNRRVRYYFIQPVVFAQPD